MNSLGSNLQRPNVGGVVLSGRAQRKVGFRFPAYSSSLFVALHSIDCSELVCETELVQDRVYSSACRLSLKSACLGDVLNLGRCYPKSQTSYCPSDYTKTRASCFLL